MYRLAFISSIDYPLTQEKIGSLEERLSQQNAKLGITGYMSYIDPVFFTYLEGRHQQVMQQMHAIEQDEQQNIISIVDLGHGDERLFVDWGMVIDVHERRVAPGLKDLMVGMQKFVHASGPVFDLVMGTVEMAAAHHSLLSSVSKETDLERATTRIKKNAMTA